MKKHLCQLKSLLVIATDIYVYICKLKFFINLYYLVIEFRKCNMKKKFVFKWFYQEQGKIVMKAFLSIKLTHNVESV